ncbi:MAG: hypothetical protein ACR2JS_06430 [Candidatus Nanopelagicales bacterium]
MSTSCQNTKIARIRLDNFGRALRRIKPRSGVERTRNDHLRPGCYHARDTK